MLRRMTSRDRRIFSDDARRKIYRWSFPIKLTPYNVMMRRRSALARKIEHFEKVRAREIAGLMTRQCLGIHAADPPYLVTLTRLYCGRGKKWDDDSLPPAMKAVRDGVAAALGVDDGDEDKILFSYRQRREESSEPGVLCEIESFGPL